MADFTDIPDVPVAPKSDRIDPNQVASGMSRGIQQLGSDKVYSDGGNQQIIVEDSNEPRVMMGNHATFGEGFYVSKDGTNVKTNTNPANLIFNSSQNVFKIVATGSGTVAGVDNSASGNWAAYGATNVTTIPHGLSFIPSLLCYVTGGTSFFGTQYRLTPCPTLFNAALGFPWQEYVDATIDATNVYVRYAVCPGSNASARSATFKYYLLQETAN